MKVKTTGARILIIALTAALLGGCGGGRDSGGAGSSTDTAQTEATGGASASAEATAEANPAEEASAAETVSTAEEASSDGVASTAEEASTAGEETSDPATDGESHPGRLVAIIEDANGAAAVTGTWMEMNDDGTGTFCREGTEYAVTYTTEKTDESVDNGLTDGGMVYVIEVEDGTKLQGFFLGLGMFECITVDEFIPANEIIRYDGGEEDDFYMMVQEGSEMWDMMGIPATDGAGNTDDEALPGDGIIEVFGGQYQNDNAGVVSNIWDQSTGIVFSFGIEDASFQGDTSYDDVRGRLGFLAVDYPTDTEVTGYVEKDGDGIRVTFTGSDSGWISAGDVYTLDRVDY